MERCGCHTGINCADCESESSTVYACRGCGRNVESIDGIEYETQIPYPHSIWFCGIECVQFRRRMLNKYAIENRIDLFDSEVQDILTAVSMIEKQYHIALSTCSMDTGDVSPRIRLRISGPMTTVA